MYGALPCLADFSTTSSGFIHDVVGVRISFLFKAERCSAVWMGPAVFARHPSEHVRQLPPLGCREPLCSA